MVDVLSGGVAIAIAETDHEKWLGFVRGRKNGVDSG